MGGTLTIHPARRGSFLKLLPPGYYVLDRNRDDCYLAGPFARREQAVQEQNNWRGATDPYVVANDLRGPAPE